MPLLHLSLDARTTDQTKKNHRTDNKWVLSLSHTVAEQVITLKEVFIHTELDAQGGAQATIPITSPATQGATGKTFLLFKLEQGGGNCIAHRQIVSNVKGGSWFPVPCDYSAGRSQTQHYVGLNQDVILDKEGLPNDLEVEVYSDEDVNFNTYPTFGTGADNISRIDLVFEYDNTERASDAN